MIIFNLFYNNFELIIIYMLKDKKKSIKKFYQILIFIKIKLQKKN